MELIRGVWLDFLTWLAESWCMPHEFVRCGGGDYILATRVCNHCGLAEELTEWEEEWVRVGNARRTR